MINDINNQTKLMSEYNASNADSTLTAGKILHMYDTFSAYNP